MAGLADGENAEKDDALGDTASIEKKYILNVIGICKNLWFRGLNFSSRDQVSKE